MTALPLAQFTGDQLDSITEQMSGWIWSLPLFFLLLGCGLVFSIITKFVQWRVLTHGWAVIRGKYDNPDDPGHINHFQALSAALSATIGLGNIAGVAVAIATGGPGAVFWMWLVGLFGMALKFTECTLAVMYRDEESKPAESTPEEAAAFEREPHSGPHETHEVRGGPMWYIQKALVEPAKAKGSPWWMVFQTLAVIFAAGAILNSFGSGNMFQGWNVSDVLEKNFALDRWLSAGVIAALVAAVILGGIKRIGNVASRLVPFMCVVYVISALAVLILHATDIPKYLGLIVQSAFTPIAGQGAFFGVTVWVAFEQGLRRALFSNEAGQGSAAIAHAAAKTDEPIREGVVAGIGPFIDTLIICTMTALVILATGTWNREPLGIVQSVSNERMVIVVNPDVAPEFASLYLERLQAPEATGSEFSIHVALGVGVKPDDVKLGIPSGIVPTDGEIEWTALNTLEINVASLSKENRGKLAPEQPVHLEMDGAELTRFAFDTTLPGWGRWMITIGVVLFAFSTMISWSYYGEKGAEYLFGVGAIIPYKLVFVGFVVLGMLLDRFNWVYNFSDTTVGLMTLCNLPALLLLAPRLLEAAGKYFARLDSGEMKRTR